MDNFVADAIFIDAEPHRVFSALGDPQDVIEWMQGEYVEASDEEGGTFLVRRPDGSELSGTIAASEKHARLEIAPYFWECGDERRGPMKVLFELQPHDGGVWLTVRQDGLDAQGDWYDFATTTRREWVAATVALKRHIEQI